MSQGKKCYHCEHVFSEDENPSRRDECPQCSKDVRVCLNCKFFEKSAGRQCLENQADLITDKEKSNFCSWFKFEPRKTTDEKNNNLKDLNALFSGHSKDHKTESNAQDAIESQLKCFLESR